jgi:hypothetical protein
MAAARCIDPRWGRFELRTTEDCGRDLSDVEMLDGAVLPDLKTREASDAEIGGCHAFEDGANRRATRADEAICATASSIACTGRSWWARLICTNRWLNWRVK